MRSKIIKIFIVLVFCLGVFAFSEGDKKQRRIVNQDDTEKLEPFEEWGGFNVKKNK